MSAAKRKPRTVLDWLESEYIVDAITAAGLRQIVETPRGPGVQLTQPQVIHLQLLLHQLMQPHRADSRIARKRDYAIAYEHAYYKSLGDNAAILRTAESWGLSRRTVSNAVKKNPINMSPDSRRDPGLSRVFADARKTYGARPRNRKR